MTGKAGVFSTYQPIYAEHGIATFPVRIVANDNGKFDKRPATKGYLRTGIRGITELARKFTDANALGFACGPRSKVTLVDIDSKDDRHLADALVRFGDTPLISRTASGGFHAWFRHNSEGRAIRPVHGLPVDILGGGYAVAPPSLVPGGGYEFIQGSLDDVARLPTMRSVPP
jgi:hypothetical protein